MLSVGSVAVKAKVIALYAVVLSNANHRRQNVRRGEANRVCGLTAPLLNPIPLSSLYLTASVYIYIYIPIHRLRNSSSPLPFQFHVRRDEGGGGEIFPPRIWLKTD